MSEPRLLRMDMHLHTHASFDCASRPEEVLRTAERRGLDRLVVTDHNEIRAALRLREMAPGRVLVGEEVKTREGIDVIGILLTELIPKGTPARETCERIRGQGGVVYVPHPFDGARGRGGRYLEEIADLVDVVEVHNARCLRESTNRRAEEWAAARGKLRGAGSDAHTLAELGAGYVELPEFEPERESLLAALGKARVAGTVRSSPLFRLASLWARVQKRLPLQPNDGDR